MAKAFSVIIGWDGYKAEAHSLAETHQIVKDYLKQWMQHGDFIVKINGHKPNTYIARVVTKYYENTDAHVVYEVLE